jgi:hypothetical protein
MNSDINPETGVTPTTDTATALTTTVDTAANPVVNPVVNPAISATDTTALSAASAATAATDIRSDDEEDGEDEVSPLDSLPTVAFQYAEVDKMLKDAFNYKESNGSMICDIIAMYLKGQKILYTEAKTLCEQRLNYLMIPTIVITALCAVIGSVLKEYSYSSTIVSSLNGLNFLFLTLINYLKLDAKSEAHRISAYKFDKIQSKLEFNSGKILFIVGEIALLPQLINDTEKDVREIKESNQFTLPESIRYDYPVLNSINVFAEVKKIQSAETILINRLKDTLNEHVKINLKVHSTDTPNFNDIQKLAELDTLRKVTTDQIIRIKERYLQIDDQFEEEMKTQRAKFSKRYQFCGWLKT